MSLLWLAASTFCLVALSGCPATTDDDDDDDGEAAYEPNDSMDTASELELPVTLTAAIDVPQDQDWFSFEAADDVELALSAVDPGLELYINVYDGAGDAVVSWDTGARGAPFADIIEVVDPGVFFVMLERPPGRGAAAVRCSCSEAGNLLQR